MSAVILVAGFNGERKTNGHPQVPVEVDNNSLGTGRFPCDRDRRSVGAVIHRERDQCAHCTAGPERVDRGGEVAGTRDRKGGRQSRVAGVDNFVGVATGDADYAGASVRYAK